jgi:hypothetical protein
MLRGINVFWQPSLKFQRSLTIFFLSPPLFSLPQDQGCDAANKEGGCRIEPTGTAEEVVGKVWQDRDDATDIPRLGRDGDR